MLMIMNFSLLVNFKSKVLYAFSMDTLSQPGACQAVFFLISVVNVSSL